MFQSNPRRTILIVAFVGLAAAVAISVAIGQQGANLSGLTNPAAARGQYNVDTAQAIQTLSQTKHQSIENHDYAVSSYYQNRQVHDQFMAGQQAPRLTEDQLRKIAAQAGPGRLSSTQFDRSTNVIQWPALLRDSQFSDVRYKVDKLFHDRTPDNSGVDSDSYGNIKQTCEAMKDILRGMIKDLPPVTFIAVDHFIRSLEYEGRFAAK